jgi:hypothetical protein
VNRIAELADDEHLAARRFLAGTASCCSVMPPSSPTCANAGFWLRSPMAVPGRDPPEDTDLQEATVTVR